jgi:hypothetical protein
MPTVSGKESGIPEVAIVINHSLASAGVSMRRALAGIGPEDMAREPSPEWRSLESVLGEATIALRDTLLAVGQDNLPEVPDGFEARYARWGTGATPDKAVLGLPVIFSGHLEALASAVRGLGPHRFDEPSDPSDAFDEDGVFSFATVGEMISSACAYVHFLAGEALVLRLALGKPAAPDPFDGLFDGAD